MRVENAHGTGLVVIEIYEEYDGQCYVRTWYHSTVRTFRPLNYEILEWRPVLSNGRRDVGCGGVIMIAR